MAVDIVEYRVRRGDTLQDIVQTAGFPRRDWRRIYDAPYNRTFRSQSPDPDHILPGACLMLPRYNTAQVADIGQRIQMAERRFGLLSEDVTKLERIIRELESTIREAQDLSERDLQRRVAELLRQAERVDERSRDVVDACRDAYTCAGAGAASANFRLEARELRRQAASLQRTVKKGEVEARKTLKKIQAAMRKYLRALSRAERNLMELRNLYRQASQRPY